VTTEFATTEYGIMFWKYFFRVDGPTVFCHDIAGLFKALKKEVNPSDWRLFIDCSQRSLKTVLRNRNSKQIPIAHSAQLKGTYGNMKVILEAIQYNVPWRSEGNRYVVALQGGFTKFCFCLCLWDSRCTAESYIKRDREPRKTYEQVKDSVQHIPMKIFLPPLHIKPGLIKCLVKAMAKTNSKGFQYLSKKSPNISTGEL
jgi:hypothetical protein